MRVYTGKFVGNGQQRAVSIGTRPGFVFGMADAAQFAACHAPEMWCGRSNAMSGSDSYNRGVSMTDDGFVVGNAPSWNTAAADTHWCALVPTDKSDFDVVSHMGNALAGTTYVAPQSRQLAALFLKRDSTLSGVLATQNSAPAALSSGGAGTWISSLGGGAFTVTAEVEVNQLDGPGGIGEEVTALCMYQSSTVATASYVGGLATNSAVISALRPIKMAIVYRVTPGGASARIITDTMTGKTKPVNASALLPSELSISGNQVLVGAPASSMNMAGVTYGVVAICDGVDALRAPAIVRSRGRKGVLLSGNLSNIDCGNADGALMINGAGSWEWCGAIYPTATDTTDCPIFLRHGGGFSGVASASWGINGFRSADGAFAWPGLQANVVTSERLINSGTDIRQGWRTGVVLPFGKLFHMVTTHSGGGNWKVFLNGKFVKQRQIDAAVVSLPNIASTSGHRTSIGARWNGSAFVSPKKLLHRVARLYNVGLTQDEVKALYERRMHASRVGDITRGLAEEWDAQNASGIYLPATVASANAGLITGGTIMTL